MMGVSSQHNIKICRILVRYKDGVDVCRNDMPTLARHLSHHPKGIREEEWFWLSERRKRVRGNDRVPGGEEPQKLRGSTKSRKEWVRPRPGKDRVHYSLRQHQSLIRRRRTAHCGFVWTTELSIKPRWRTDILSHWSWRCSTEPKEFLSPHPNQERRRVQNQATISIRGVKLSAEQWPLKQGMTLPEPQSSYTMTLPEVSEWRTRVHLTTEMSSGTERTGISVPREESIYAPSIQKMISPPRKQFLMSIETSSNTDSYLEHLLSKSARSPYP